MPSPSWLKEWEWLEYLETDGTVANSVKKQNITTYLLVELIFLKGILLEDMKKRSKTSKSKATICKFTDPPIR